MRLAFEGCAGAVGRWLVLVLVAFLLWRLSNVPLWPERWPLVVALAAVPVVPVLLVVPVKGSPEELAASKARIEEAEHALRTHPGSWSWWSCCAS
jgi:hypothetical protein